MGGRAAPRRREDAGAMVQDKDTGKIKGYGFCEFFDQGHAESAVRMLNNHEVCGRALRVAYADDNPGSGLSERERNREYKERRLAESAKREMGNAISAYSGPVEVVLSDLQAEHT
eukprot:gene25445-11106_t